MESRFPVAAVRSEMDELLKGLELGWNTYTRAPATARD
jgi:hypothetical protein